MRSLNVKGMIIPQTFQEMIEQCKMFKRQEFNRISKFSFEEIQRVVEDTFATVCELASCQDTYQHVKMCYLVNCLRKLSPDLRPQLIELANHIVSERSEQALILLSYIEAKLHDKVDGNLIRDRLEKCFMEIREGRDPLAAAYFLYFLTKHAETSVLLNSSLFIEITLYAIFTKTVEVRSIVADAIKKFLKIMIETSEASVEQFAHSMYSQAREGLMKRDPVIVHGSLLILCVLLERKLYFAFDGVDDLYSVLLVHLSSKHQEIHEQALYCLVLSGAISPDVFRERCIGSVRRIMLGKSITPIVASAVIAVHELFPEVYSDPHSNRKILKAMFGVSPLPQGFVLLSQMAKTQDSFFKENSKYVISILANTAITSDYAEHVPVLFDKYPDLWAEFKEQFTAIVVNMLKRAPSVNVLALLSRCRPIETDDLQNILVELLAHKNAKIRGAVPAALLAHSQHRQPAEKKSIVRNLITIALSDRDACVRASIVSAIMDPFIPYVCSSSDLVFLDILANDENYEVREEVMRLLARINRVTPFGVQPMFRRILLDDMFLLGSDRSHRLRCEMTRLLLIVIEAAQEIIPVYAPAICQITINHFLQAPKRNQTLFEKNNMSEISANMARIIDLIAMNDISLVAPNFTEFIELFMKILQQHNKKDLKLAVVKALITLISKGETTFDINRKQLFIEVVGIASKWNSRKLNIAFLRLMGLLGAVDQEETVNISEDNTEEITANHLNYYLKVTCKVLLQVLKDESLNASHLETIRMLITIFEDGNEASLRSFKEFMPLFIAEIQATRSPVLLKHLRRLCSSAPAKWMMLFSEELVSLVYELWGTDVLIDALGVVPVLASVLQDRFVPFLPQSISLFMDCLTANRATHPEICEKVLVSIVTLRWISSDYMFLIIPEIVGCIQYPSTMLSTRIRALDALRILIQSCEIENYAAQIVRCIGYCLAFPDPSVKRGALQVLYSLRVALGPSFAPYQQHVVEFMANNNVSGRVSSTADSAKNPLRFEALSEVIEVDNQTAKAAKSDKRRGSVRAGTTPVVIAVRFTAEESRWNRKAWLKKLADSVIACSPAKCIYMFTSLIRDVPHISEQLFNIAFLSCWEIETSDGQKLITQELTNALTSKHLAGSARYMIVSLVQFMDRAERPIDIPPDILYHACMESGHHTKALYFVNQWYRKTNSQESKNAMITTASVIGLNRTVVGLAKVFNEGFLPASWCEQLGNWEQALESYSEEEIAGRVRCYEHLLQWDRILEYEPLLESVTNEKQEVAAALIKANFFTGKIENIPALLKYAGADDAESALYTAISLDKQGNKAAALAKIEETFNILARRAQMLFKHDKSSMYPTILDAMRLTEVAEMIEGIQNDKIWAQRLEYCRKSFDAYFLIMSVRFMYNKTNEQAVKLLTKLIKTHRFNLYEPILKGLFADGEYNNEIKCVNAMLKWEKGFKKEALDDIMAIDVSQDPLKLASRVHFLRGQWMIRSVNSTDLVKAIEDSLQHLVLATKTDPNHYKAWHRWAWASATLFNDDHSRYEAAMNAISGFTQCVKLRSDNCFSDLIQMISIFFRAKLDQKSFEDVSKCITSLGDAFLLRVAPQIFAQLSNKESDVRSFVIDLINNLLPKNFHALIYPLLLLTRPDSSTPDQLVIANDLLHNLETVNPEAVAQGRIITSALLKCANSPLEKWWELVADVAGMKKDDIENIIARIDTVLNTDDPNEQSFLRDHESYIAPIQKCHSQLKEFYSQKTMSNMIILLQKFFEVLDKEIKEFKYVKIDSCAPDLEQLRDSVLAVPGTYRVGAPLVRISQFHPHLEVLTSKQHPRLVMITGSDGKQHTSLLKGHEDLRLDEHVMQFFDLMNMHLKNGFPKDLRSVKLHRYTITPLSKGSGLIQFLDDTETIYRLIAGYRRKRGMDVNIERSIASDEFIANIDALRPIQRLEMLNHVTSVTPDSDLREILWLRSSDATAWTTRTLRFTQSSAVVSIVGYILGLGDRHPSNIMMHRFSGDVIHIDFGDCFEVAQKRVSFPESVPFRLTRMMRSAFGPSGIEGEFRITCEITMNLIRAHRESIMTVLDIFMQVPLDAEASQGSASQDIGEALRKVQDKIEGKDLGNDEEMTPEQQVSRLIDDSTNNYNLAGMYHGWMPMW